jgi:transposase InsO family protein
MTTRLRHSPEQVVRKLMTAPGSTGYIESFNARIRDECLNINIFWSLAQARIVVADWNAEYNHHRRHSALGYQAPTSYAVACTHR